MIHQLSPSVESLFIHPGKPYPEVSSLAIAKIFGKRHGAVLRDIRKIIRQSPPEFTHDAYTLTSRRNRQNRELPVYQLNQDGVALLIMSYHSPKAMIWKIQYSGTFINMADQLGLDMFDLFLNGGES